MLTFEYISQLCQNKEWVCPPSDTKATEGEPSRYWVSLREPGSYQRLRAGAEGTLLDHITGPVGGEEGQESSGSGGQRLLPEE